MEINAQVLSGMERDVGYQPTPMGFSGVETGGERIAVEQLYAQGPAPQVSQ